MPRSAHRPPPAAEPLPLLIDALFESFWFSLLLRVGVTAFTVVGAAVAAEKAGPFWGALVVGLPVSAGPAYAMLAIEYDAAFLAVSALNSMAGNIGAVIFLVVLTFAAPRLAMVPSLLIATVVWFAMAWPLRSIAWTPLAASLANIAVFALALLLTRNIQPGPPTGRTVQPRWYDLPLRGLLVGVFVTAVVSVSHLIGPAATGIAAVYPIAITSLLLLLFPRIGGQTTAATMAGVVRAMIGFPVAFLVMHHTIEDWGKLPALLAALGVMLGWAALLVVHRAVRQRRVTV